MPAIGTGVREIRVNVGRAFRILYITAFAEAVYVLHVFEKKSQKTAQRDVDLARSRLKQLQRFRREDR